MRTSHRVAFVSAAMAVVVAGCSSNTPNPGPSGTDGSTTPSTSGTSGSPTAPTTSSTTTPATSSSSAPADPRVAAAVRAYDNFMATYAVSQQHPPATPDKPYVAGGDFPKYMFDPARSEYVGYVLNLTLAQLAYRGTPPMPRLSVTNADLAAKPYPTVTLTDCPTAPASWKVVATSGPPPTTKTSPKAPPPYKATVTVIFYEKRWGVSKMTVDTSKTCQP